jgi:hypothetical protein
VDAERPERMKAAGPSPSTEEATQGEKR